MTCEICGRTKRCKRADQRILDALRLNGIIEYFTPVWDRLRICRECLDDVTWMLVAIRETMHGTDAAITVNDFSRHAHALHARMHTRGRAHKQLEGLS